MDGSRQSAQFLRAALRELRFFHKIFINCFVSVFRRQLLGQPAGLFLLFEADAFRIRVILNQGRIVDPLQKCGFAVALFPDQNSLVQAVEYKIKMISQDASVPSVCDRQILYLQHCLRNLFF